jgi:hypothetical protein
LPDDDISSRGERKKVEGQHSRQIIQEGPCIDVKSISGNWKGCYQKREKISNAGRVSLYQMVRFYYHTDDTENTDESTKLLALFLNLGCWQARGYHNSLQTNDAFSLNFGQLCKNKNKATKIMTMDDNKLIITNV